MANEYLQRTPTSTGNRRVWTWSAWIKRANQYTSNAGPILFSAGTSGSNFADIRLLSDTSNCLEYINYPGSVTHQIRSTPVYRDSSSWMHILITIDTTNYTLIERLKMFINGSRITDFRATGYPSINDLSGLINAVNLHYIGRSLESSYRYFDGELTDVFFVDGQALTPDVFGFNKPGKGYISVGSTQATDFRPGQWVPKKPRVITTEINRRGGFGVNGFYLPMNDSNNFGADFHCTPNSIIKLQENLPQPRCRIDGVGDYTGSLREDPFKQYLVLAIPFVSGGLQNGFGDYSAAIKGSGSAKTGTVNGGVSIASTHSYYGSAGLFDGGSSGYISIPDSDDFNFGSGDFTIECWVNPSTTLNTTSYRRILSQQVSANWIFRLDNQGVFQTNFNDGSSGVTITSGARIDTLGQWTHIAFVRNGTTLTNYINGVAAGIQTGVTITMPNISSTVEVGRYVGGSEYYAGYIQDLRVYKGVAKYTGGFDVPRPYTPVGIATWRAVPDSTANNFATLNPLRTGGYATLDNGNLRSTGNTATNSSPALATIGVRSGKWYWELRADTVYTSSTSQWPYSGVTVVQSDWIPLNAETHNATYGVAVRERTTGNNPSVIGISGKTTVSSVTAISGLANGDVLMCAMDADNGAIYFGKNGTWYNSGTPASGSSRTGSIFNYTPSTDDYTLIPNTINYNGSIGSVNFGQNPTFSGNTTAGTFTDSNGKGLFKYQPPSGFLALCEDNLPTPAISDPGKYFKTVLYAGDTQTGRSITGIGFTPDLVWMKVRNDAQHGRIYDSVRGATIRLVPSLTQADTVKTDELISFNSDGFSLGNNTDINGSGYNYVAWCWRAGAGTTSTNTNGSITSVVSVNIDAGFSIVSYTGTGANATVGHGLGRAPKFIITKSRTTADDWFTYHSSLGNGSYILLDTTATSTVSSTIWNNTSPTSTTFSLGTSGGANRLNDRLIAYCWAEIEGFSKFGSYVGNGSVDGPFVYCGFKPAWVMIKRTNSSQYWVIIDNCRSSTNPTGQSIFANTSDTEYTDLNFREMDFLSNGFKIRAGAGTERNDGTYIFAAFAESPINYSNAK